MAKSNQSRTARKATPAKPKKPRPDFPLFPHATGRWAKKIRGKFVYFGKCADDPKGEAALSLWLDTKDDLLAGRTPRISGDGLTVRDLANRFLSAKQQQRDTGEIANGTFLDYHRTCERIVNVFGKSRLVDDLASDDFESLRGIIAKTSGVVRLGNEITRIRVVFKYGYDAGLIDKPMRYGPTFKRPSKKVLRKERNARGSRMFEPAEVLAMIDAATIPLKTMILLGINIGFGNSDCGTLPMSAVDLDGGWITFPRPKTGIQRRAKLWPETVEALKLAIAERPKPKDAADAGLLFLTKYGQPWAKETHDNPVTKETRKLLDSLGIHRPGLGFYALRHTFRTVADETRDFPACDFIMGHARDDMASVYRERIGDDRLQAVVNHVRQWLFGDAAGDVGTAADPVAVEAAAGDDRRKGRSGLRIVG
jgi:integrase